MGPKFQVSVLKWHHYQLVTHVFFLAKGTPIHTHGFLGDADIGCDLHAVRGGNQLSEVLLADPETSVFRVCC